MEFTQYSKKKPRNIKILKRRIREKSFKKDIHVYSQLS